MRIFEDFFDDVDIVVGDQAVDNARNINKPDHEQADSRQFQHYVSFYYYVATRDDIAAVAGWLTDIIQRIDLIINNSDLLADHSLTLMYYSNKPSHAPVIEEKYDIIARYNCYSENIEHCFDDIIKQGTMGNGSNTLYTMQEFQNYGFEIRLGFNLDITKSSFVKMLKCCASVLYVSTNIINEATKKKCASGLYLHDFKLFVNANKQTGKLINEQIRKAYIKANKKYEFELNINKNADMIVPDGFFSGIPDRLSDKYKTAVASTNVKISEKDNHLEVIFDKDVVLYKVVLIIELAQNFISSDNPEDIRVFINKTLYINEDVLEDRDWVKFIEYIHKVVVTDVVFENGFNDLKLPENIFIDEMEINNPYAPNRRFYFPKMFIDKKQLKNKDIEITSTTHEVSLQNYNKERICIEFKK